LCSKSGGPTGGTASPSYTCQLIRANCVATRARSRLGPPLRSNDDFIESSVIVRTHVSFFLFTDRAPVILVLLEASRRPDASAGNRVGLHREKPENARVVREHKGDSRGVLTADRKNFRESCRGQDSRSREYPQAGIHPPDSPLNFFSRQRPRRSIRKGARGTARCLEFSRRTRGAGILSLLGYAERARLFGASWIRHESLYVSLPPGRETSRDLGDCPSGTVDRGR